MSLKKRFQFLLDYQSITLQRFAYDHDIDTKECYQLSQRVGTIIESEFTSNPLLKFEWDKRSK